jgi:hypothetical protein
MRIARIVYMIRFMGPPWVADTLPPAARDVQFVLFLDIKKRHGGTHMPFCQS